MEDNGTRKARLTFHPTHSDGIRVSEKGKLASHVLKYPHRLLFVNRPIAVNECFYLGFHLLEYRGVSVYVGCTTTDPRHVRNLDKKDLPALANTPGFWTVKVDLNYGMDKKRSDSGTDKAYNRIKLMVDIHLTTDGRMTLGGIGRKELIAGLPQNQDVWPMVVLTNNVDYVRILGHETIEGKISQKRWLSFHPNHGENIEIGSNRRRARRVRSFCHGISFVESPVAVNEAVHIRCRLNNVWGGGLCVGCTIHDPAMIEELPRQSIPSLAEKPGFWVKELDILPWMYKRGSFPPPDDRDTDSSDTEDEDYDTDSLGSDTDYESSYVESSDTDSDTERKRPNYKQNAEVKIRFYLTTDGRIVYGPDRRKTQNLFTGLPTNKKLWLLLDLFGKANFVGIWGKLVSGCATSNQIKTLHDQQQHQDAADETDHLHYCFQWEFMDSEQCKLRRLQQKFSKKWEGDFKYQPEALIPWLQGQLEEIYERLQWANQVVTQKAKGGFVTQQAQQCIHRNMLILKLTANIQKTCYNIKVSTFLFSLSKRPISFQQCDSDITQLKLQMPRIAIL